MQMIQPVESKAFDDTGTISNMVRTLAKSPHSLEGYLQLNKALSGGKLSPKLREQIALFVAHVNQCEYSLTQHAWQAAQLGLSYDEIVASRRARTNDPKTNTALQFARDVVLRSAGTSIRVLREAGYDDAEIVEIVANVALNLFENHFNEVARTELDFPDVPSASYASFASTAAA